MLLKPLLDKFIQVGTLHVTDASGNTYTFHGKQGPEAGIRLHTKIIEYRFLWNPDIALGEGYTNGEITIEKGNLRDFLDLCTQNEALKPFKHIKNSFNFFLRPFRYLYQNNSFTKSKQHVAHHYDLSGKLYELFLDKDKQYSCAYFINPNDDLQTAQENKKRHIAAKLCLQSGQKILDIGSGWGGLAFYLAQVADVEVTGLTLSEEQFKIATERAQHLGLSDRVRFYLRDYRTEKGAYDRIVSIGMFEHVGVPYYHHFFEQVHNLLTENGIALLSAIGHNGEPNDRRGWINKYIFPGGYSPAISEVIKPIERSNLFITDMEILYRHYAYTLSHWTRQFQLERDKIKSLYDERFCRMWEYYLIGCEMVFRNLGYMVFQLQLVRNPRTAPLTRDYVREEESRLKSVHTHE